MAQDYPKTFSYDDLMVAADLENVSISRAAARTKMMSYVNEGLVERVNDGQFRLTPTGADAAGVQLGKKEGSGAAAPEPTSAGNNDSGSIASMSLDPLRRNLLSATSGVPFVTNPNPRVQR